MAQQPEKTDQIETVEETVDAKIERLEKLVVRLREEAAQSAELLNIANDRINALSETTGETLDRLVKAKADVKQLQRVNEILRAQVNAGGSRSELLSSSSKRTLGNTPQAVDQQ